jgi:Glycogen recognition site of AMP-activated protein kinase
MSLPDLHQVILRWCVATLYSRVLHIANPHYPTHLKNRPNADANEVIVTGTFDQASLLVNFSILYIISFALMPAITTGFSLRLPSFIFSSAPHLCIQWSSSVRLVRKPDGFEAPVLIPWKDKIAYKFIVDGRWMTNDTEPTEIDGSFINNVYTAPPKPALPKPVQLTAPPSYHSESEAEPEHTDKVPEHSDKPAVNGSAIDTHHQVPEHTADEPASTVAEEVKAAVTPTVQVVPNTQEVERSSDEVCLDFCLELDSILTRAK